MTSYNEIKLRRINKLANSLIVKILNNDISQEVIKGNIRVIIDSSNNKANVYVDRPSMDIIEEFKKNGLKKISSNGWQGQLTNKILEWYQYQASSANSLLLPIYVSYGVSLLSELKIYSKEISTKIGIPTDIYAEEAFNSIKTSIDKINADAQDKINIIKDRLNRGYISINTAKIRVKKVVADLKLKNKEIIVSATGKMSAKIKGDLYPLVGVKRYKWVTRGDSLVRQSHRILNGQIFEYGNPPITNGYGDKNQPGGDYNCRCIDKPIL